MRVVVSLRMPSSHYIQRRIERLEQTNLSPPRRFVFDVRTFVTLLGEEALTPKPDIEATTHGEYAIPAAPR